MKFRKKPITVEAIQFEHWGGKFTALDSDLSPREILNLPYRGSLLSAEEICKWSCGLVYKDAHHPTDGWCISLTVSTPEGFMRARPGDWIIRGVRGEFYPCRDEIFQQTYEKVCDDESL